MNCDWCKQPLPALDSDEAGACEQPGEHADATHVTVEYNHLAYTCDRDHDCNGPDDEYDLCDDCKVALARFMYRRCEPKPTKEQEEAARLVLIDEADSCREVFDPRDWANWVETALGEGKPLVTYAREILGERSQTWEPISLLMDEGDWKARVLDPLGVVERHRTCPICDVITDTDDAISNGKSIGCHGCDAEFDSWECYEAHLLFNPSHRSGDDARTFEFPFSGAIIAFHEQKDDGGRLTGNFLALLISDADGAVIAGHSELVRLGDIPDVVDEFVTKGFVTPLI